MESIKQKDILKFWFPLASSWLVMAIEGPVVAASIARSPRPEINLAAYGLAFSLALFIEAPGVMILSATTTLVRDAESFLRMRKFTILMAAIGVMLGSVLVIPDFFQFLVGELNISSEVREIFYQAAFMAIPLPLILGLKRFYQGVLIWGGRTRWVFRSTLIRTISLGILVASTSHWGSLTGAVLGIVFLIVSSGIETFILYLLSRKVKCKLITGTQHISSGSPIYNFKQLTKFYIPLASVAFLGLGLQPAVTFLVSKGVSAIDSLAVLPVVLGLVFVFRCFGISFNEAILSLLRQNPENYRALRVFAIRLGIACFFLFGIILIPSVSRALMIEVSGLPPRLYDIAQSTLILFFPIPLLTLWNTWQKALAVDQRNSSVVSQASIAELSVTLGMIYFGIQATSLPGAYLAALGMVGGRVASILWFYAAPRVQPAMQGNFSMGRKETYLKSS